MMQDAEKPALEFLAAQRRDEISAEDFRRMVRFRNQQSADVFPEEHRPSGQRELFRALAAE